MENKYYVVKNESGLYELRQSRYKGMNHKNDICGVAQSQADLMLIYDKIFTGGVDLLSE